MSATASPKPPTDPLPFHLIKMPWESTKWIACRNSISGKITNIGELETKLMNLNASITGFRREHVSRMFTRYWEDANDANGHITREKFMEKILPTMQELALNSAKYFKSTRMFPLYKDSPPRLALNRLQVACLIIHMWFGTFKYKYIAGADLEKYQIPCFAYMFTHENYTVFRSIMAYFNAVYENMIDAELKKNFEAQIVIYERKVLPGEPSWLDAAMPICPVEFVPLDKINEVVGGDIYAAPCGELLGGQDLHVVTTREIAHMCIYPESMVLYLIAHSLEGDEIYGVTGAQRINLFSLTLGTCRYICPDRDSHSPVGIRGNVKMIRRVIVFMMASRSPKTKMQMINHFDEDLNTAYNAFSIYPEAGGIRAIVSPHWAYERVMANAQIKFLQLLMAASAAGRRLIYLYDNDELREYAEALLDFIKTNKITIAKLYTMYGQMMPQFDSGMWSQANDLNILSLITDQY